MAGLPDSSACVRVAPPVAWSLALVLTATPAAAFPNFWKVFDEVYLEDHENELFVEQVRDKEAKVNCLICHQGLKKKKHRNEFGTHLDDILDKKVNRALSKKKRDPAVYEEARTKVIEALKDVCEKPVDPRDPEGETFGDRLSEGKWPGGELENLKVEPPDPDDGEGA